MKSSKANMALMFSEQGNYFELYDNHSNIYQGTDFEEIDIPDLLLESAGNIYPMSLKLGECYLLFYTQDEKIVSSEMEARYFISNWKIIRVNSIAGKNLSQHSRAITAALFTL